MLVRIERSIVSNSSFFTREFFLLTLYLSSFMLPRAEDFEKAYLSKEKGKEKP